MEAWFECCVNPPIEDKVECCGCVTLDRITGANINPRFWRALTVASITAMVVLLITIKLTAPIGINLVIDEHDPPLSNATTFEMLKRAKHPIASLFRAVYQYVTGTKFSSWYERVEEYENEILGVFVTVCAIAAKLVCDWIARYVAADDNERFDMLERFRRWVCIGALLSGSVALMLARQWLCSWLDPSRAGLRLLLPPGEWCVATPMAAWYLFCVLIHCGLNYDLRMLQRRRTRVLKKHARALGKRTE